MKKLIEVIKEIFSRRNKMGYNGKEHLNWIQSLINHGKKNYPDFEQNEISDGYHTFNELYEFRKLYNALLFNMWASKGMYDVHKSWKHNDGEDCFAGSDSKWFVVVAILPGGQITNHYEQNDWTLFNIPAVFKAKYEFDGHTAKDVLDRLKEIL